MDATAREAVEVCCLTDDAAALPSEEVFLLDGAALPERPQPCRGIVLTNAGEARARELLATGASCVLIGEAALRDPNIIDILSREFGPERIGVYVPAARMGVSWSMNSVSNADFKFMAPSLCEPTWEVLRADGTRTGVFAPWWIEEMTKRGAATVLVRADIEDDTDLNLCAGLAEQCGEALWIGPLYREPMRLADWIEYGHARQLIFSRKTYEEHDAVLALRAAGDRVEQQQGAAA